MKTLTLEETIQWMEKCIFEGADWDEDFWSNYTDALNYLKKYQHYQNTPSCMCHIAMCDEQALTWNELCKLHMIGEPVWNSSTRRWMLVIDSAYDGTWIELINHAGGHEKWIEHDLRKNPLYRKEKK